MMQDEIEVRKENQLLRKNRAIMEYRTYLGKMFNL